MRKLLLAAILAAPAALPIAARADAGTTGAATLSRPFGSRALGMARAFTAVPGGLESADYNPAGLAAAKKPALATSYTHGQLEDSFGYLGYAHPLKFAVLDAGLIYYDAGTIHLNLSDGTNTTVRAEQDYVGMLGAAIPLPHDLTIGAIAKAYRFTLAQQATARGFAADLGAQWRSPIKGLTLGAAVQNAGPDVKFEQTGDKLPLTERAGAAYTTNLSALGGGPQDDTFSLSEAALAIDGFQTRGSPVAATVGLELSTPVGYGRAAIRGGYVFASDFELAAFGVGLKQGRFLFDYALGINKALSDTQNFTIGVEF